MDWLIFALTLVALVCVYFGFMKAPLKQKDNMTKEERDVWLKQRMENMGSAVYPRGQETKSPMWNQANFRKGR